MDRDICEVLSFCYVYNVSVIFQDLMVKCINNT